MVVGIKAHHPALTEAAEATDMVTTAALTGNSTDNKKGAYKK
jgi:hypothetical protein